MQPPLNPGTRLGPYEILGPLGSGGMGEVYRARDLKLQRDVAIKVLPSSVASDADRLARFRREAQLLASLNHPHIGAIYGVEDTDRIALILELVDGATLAERIEQGALPWKESLAIAIQIADGLEAAHQQGVVHRDLKPANVKLSTSGRAKVLDFGLAKIAGSGVFAGNANSMAATATFDGTREGIVLGTIGYMSPEQARGQAIDKRTDIWAFGCVLFEMLTGSQPFAGHTPTDTVAAIVERDPQWNLLPPSVPSAVRDVIRHCLAKDCRRRFHDLADVRIQLEDALAAPAAEPVTDRRRAWRPLVAGVAAGAVGSAFIAALVVRGSSPRVATSTVTPDLLRLHVLADADLAQLGTSCAAGGCGDEGILALSPDGKLLAYAAGAGERRQLYVRALDDFKSRPIPGTEGGMAPTFSPDGHFIAFVADRKLKRVGLDGSPPTVLREFTEGNGLSWGDDGNIYFNPGLATGIWKIPASGGQATALTAVGKEVAHHFPELLPGGSALLFSALAGITNERIYVQVLKTGERRALVEGASPHYLPTGHLVYVQSGRLMAVRFDPAALEVRGTPAVVIDGVGQTLLGTPLIAFSRSGSMAYVSASSESTQSELVWVTPAGVASSTHGSGRAYAQPRLSPDEKRVAASLRTNPSDIWEFDLTREIWNRLTFDGHSSFPLWTPNGRRLTFSSGQTGATNVFWKSADGSEQDSRLILGDRANVPLSWSPDGKTLVYVLVDPQNAQDLWTFSLDDKKSQPFLQTKFREGGAVFSPDGRWLAYVSDESGRNEIYVRPYPGPGQKWTISSEGGVEPVWPRQSQQLFYRNGDAMMAVDVTTSPEFSAGKPRVLFEGHYERSNAYWPNYDATPDGRKLLMLRPVDRPAPVRQIDIVLNWVEELKQRVP